MYWLVAAFVSASSPTCGHEFGPVLLVIGAVFAITGLACGAIWYSTTSQSSAVAQLQLLWLLPTCGLSCGGVVALGTWPVSASPQGLRIALVVLFGVGSLGITLTLYRWFVLTRTAVAHAKRISIPVHDHTAAVAPSDANTLAILRHVLDASVAAFGCCAAVVTVLLLSRHTASSGIPTVSGPLMSSMACYHVFLWCQAWLISVCVAFGSVTLILEPLLLCTHAGWAGIGRPVASKTP
jgi:hypothetical protein